MKEVAKAVFSIAEDTSGYVFEGTVVTYENRLWLVSTWRLPHGAKEKIPEWLVPLDALGYRGPTQGAVLSLGTEVPKTLLGLGAEPEALRRAGAVLNPLLANTPKDGRTLQ